MIAILAIALILVIALYWRERRIRQAYVTEWRNAYNNLWSEYQFTALTLQEITGIDIL